jgi:hypothetical protein
LSLNNRKRHADAPEAVEKEEGSETSYDKDAPLFSPGEAGRIFGGLIRS